MTEYHYTITLTELRDSEKLFRDDKYRAVGTATAKSGQLITRTCDAHSEKAAEKHVRALLADALREPQVRTITGTIRVP